MTSNPDNHFEKPDGPDPDSGSAEPCARCGGQPASVQSFMWVMSFVVFTRHSEYEAIVCRGCATRLALKEHAKSSVLGWWGIPWGLRTFQAVWINTRTLLRWSSLGATGALLVGLLGLSLPAALGYYVYASMQEESLSRSTGDWVDDDVAELVEQGHAAASPEAALTFYRQAHERAPDSSVINHVMASALYKLQRFDEALPHAAKAEAKAPRAISYRALHGCLLTISGEAAEATARAEELADRVPADADDAYWMVELYYRLDDYEQQVKAATAVLRLKPDAEYYLGIKINALLQLDRVEELENVVDALDPAVAESETLEYHLQIYRMRTAPVEETDRILKDWPADAYDYRYMERLVEAAERSGEIEAVRAKVEAWLMVAGPTTLSWQLARPWFDEDDWVPALDRYLAARPGVWPALLRIQEIDQIANPEAVVELVDRNRIDDDPDMPLLDSLHYSALARSKSRAAALADLEAHTDARPDHTSCLFLLARERIDADPAAAGELLDRIENSSTEDPGLLADLEMTRIELALIDGRASEVLEAATALGAATITYRSPERYDLLVAETAFHAGDRSVMDERLERIRDAGQAETRAPAMLIGWSAQWAGGELPSYDEDVAAWLADGGEELRSSMSLTAQGILLAEGMVDRAWVRRVTEDRPADTLALVSAIKNASASGRLIDADIDPIATSSYEGSYAHRLARTILRGRASAQKQ